MSVYIDRRGVPLGALSSGNRGIGVTDLQNKLVQLGFKISPDGVFGPATKTAVMAVQQLAKIDVDGIVGPDTEKAINDMLAADAERAKSTKKSRLSSVKEARERTRLRIIGDAGQAKADADFAKMRERAMQSLPARLAADRARRAAAQEAAATTDTATSSSPSSVAAGAASKLPIIIGGVAALGIVAVLFTGKKK